MSSQYPYPYPQGPYPPQQQPQFPDPGGSQGKPNITVPEPGPHDVYVPVEKAVPPEGDWAQIRSMQLSNIAAGAAPVELGVKVPEGSIDYPLAMYNAKTRTVKPAKDKEDEQKLSGEGFSRDPFPAEDPNAVSAEMLKSLQEVWTKAGDALKKLIQLVEQQEKQMAAAGKMLDAGQQQPQQQQQWQQPQYPPAAYPPSGD